MLPRILLILPLLALAGCAYIPASLGGDKEAPVERAPGERIAVMSGGPAIQADPALADAALSLPSPEINTGWVQHGGNVLGQLPHPALPVKLEKVQRESVGDGDSYPHNLIVAPVVAEGAVYAMDANGKISSHDAGDIGELRWISPGVATENGEPVMGGGLAYEADRLFAASGKGLVAALDAKSGLELWRQPLNIPIRSAPRADSGRVYVVTVDSQLFALDGKSGEVLWSHRGINEATGFLIEASPVATADYVVAPYTSGEIHVLRADDGSEVWNDMLLSPQRISASSVFTGIGGDPVIEGDALYVPGSAGLFAAFQLSTGRRLWEQPIASLNTPWVAGDALYILSTDAQLICLQRLDGRVKWATQLPVYEDAAKKKNHYTWHGPVLAGGRLLAVGAHGELMSANPETGQLLETQTIPDEAFVGPVIAGNVLYLVTRNAKLNAIY
jgi:outer membrane protein assembly factor BamB